MPVHLAKVWPVREQPSGVYELLELEHPRQPLLHGERTNCLAVAKGQVLGEGKNRIRVLLGNRPQDTFEFVGWRTSKTIIFRRNCSAAALIKSRCTRIAGSTGL